MLKPKGLLQSPPGATLVAPDPESIGTIAGQLVQVSKEDVVDNVHVGDVAKYNFFDQVTLQARVKEDSGAVTWAETMMVRFPMWMKGHAVGRDPAAVFIGGTLYQIKGDSHTYVQTWRLHGGQLKQAKRVQWSGVCNYEDSEVSLKRGKLRQIKAKTENPTYCPPPTFTPIPQCFLNKNQASLLLNHPKRCRRHPTAACFMSGRSLFTHSQNGGFP